MLGEPEMTQQKSKHDSANDVKIIFKASSCLKCTRPDIKQSSDEMFSVELFKSAA